MSKVSYGLIVVVAALGSVSAGCGMGAMQQSVMAGDCGPDDDQCLLAGLDAPLAVGAQMRPHVRTLLRGSGSPGLRLESVAPDVIQNHDGKLVGKAPGVAAVLIAMDDGTVIDFNHLWVKTPTRLELHAIAADGSDLGERTGMMELFVGEDLRLFPQAYADSQRLMGRAVARWQVDPTIATVLREGTSDSRRLVALAPGKTTLTIATLGLQSSLQLVVHARQNAASATAGAVGAEPVAAATATTVPVSQSEVRP